MSPSPVMKVLRVRVRGTQVFAGRSEPAATEAATTNSKMKLKRQCLVIIGAIRSLPLRLFGRPLVESLYACITMIVILFVS